MAPDYTDAELAPAMRLPVKQGSALCVHAAYRHHLGSLGSGACAGVPLGRDDGAAELAAAQPEALVGGAPGELAPLGRLKFRGHMLRILLKPDCLPSYHQVGCREGGV